MPTHDFECSNGHRHERMYPMGRAPKSRPCPECGEHAKKLLGPGAGFIFKGSGFYATDYRGKK